MSKFIRRSSFQFSTRAMLATATLVAFGLYYLVLPTINARQFAQSLSGGGTEFGNCDATVEPVNVWQLMTATRTVRAKTQFGTGFKRIVFEVTPRRVEKTSEEIPVYEWMWGLREMHT